MQLKQKKGHIWNSVAPIKHMISEDYEWRVFFILLFDDQM